MTRGYLQACSHFPHNMEQMNTEFAFIKILDESYISLNMFKVLSVTKTQGSTLTFYTTFHCGK